MPQPNSSPRLRRNSQPAKPPSGYKQDRSVEKFLHKLFEKKQLSEAEWRASLSYVHDFAMAKMHGHYSRVHYEDIGMSASQNTHANDNYEPGERIIAARNRLHQREQILGRTATQVLYHVLGLGMSLQDYAHRLRDGGYGGVPKPLNPSQVNGLLLAAIARLAEI